MNSFKYLLRIIIILSIFILFHNCSTRYFTINSTPDSTMVVMLTSSNHLIPSGSACGKTPVKQTVTFIGKGDTYSFVAMKRNYEPDTIVVTRDSPLAIDFNLKEISDKKASGSRLNKDADIKISLLPIDSEIVLHKGVGNLDKYEKSDELSRKVRDSLNMKITTTCLDSGLHYVSLEKLNEKADSLPVLIELRNYLLSLNIQLIPYYTEPPRFSESVIDQLSHIKAYSDDDSIPDRSYWLYVWCKSIKPTSGRVIGNIAANIGAGAVQGYETAMYGTPVSYVNPDAFALDYHTIFMVAMIEPHTGELLSIDQYRLPFELTNSKSQDSFIETLMEHIAW